MINILLFIAFIIIVNIIIGKFNLLPNYSGNDHQIFANEGNIQLSGGIFILILFMISFFHEIILICFFSSIFLIGLASDKNLLTSPKKRLILQIIIVLSFVYLFNLRIFETRVEIINSLLSNNLLAYIFASFCILVLINGSNFIDGLNSLLLGYLIIILFIIFKLDLLSQIGLNEDKIYFLFSILFFIMIMNYFNLLFLGDSGSYLIGLFLSYLIISIYNLNLNIISPYFIIVLVWYPCFENLFSIIRKKLNNLSPTYADHKHLHQLIFIYSKRAINLEKKFLNPIVSIFINLFNLTVLSFASLHYNNSTLQISILVFCIIVYLILYFFLAKKLSSVFIEK